MADVANKLEIDQVVTANHLSGPAQGQWTYDDYATIPYDGKHYEIIEGVLYMAPAPGTFHQSSNARFTYYLFLHVELAGLGRVFPVPFDVQLSGTQNVVEPDVIVVLNANLNIITDSRIVGSPDLVIEITSPGTASYDRKTKQPAYARAGVREYWIANPLTRTIEVLILEGKSYRSEEVFQGQDLLPSQGVPGLPVEVEKFFA